MAKFIVVHPVGKELTLEAGKPAGMAGKASIEKFDQLGVAARQLQVQLLFGDDTRGLREQQINRAAGAQQAFEQTYSVSHAGSAGECERDAFHGYGSAG